MKRKGPIVTVAAGALFAAVLMVLNINANATNGSGTDATEDGTKPAATSPAATPAMTPSATRPPATAQVSYAGAVGGSGATIAIAITDGQVIAYVCDGKTAEAWLRGTASSGVLRLRNAGGDSLTGEYSASKATGVVTAAGKRWNFSISQVKPPSGLYRASAQVRAAKVVGGWIVLADGTQVGVVTVDGQPQSAPSLNTATLTVEVDGAAVTAAPVDGTKLD